MFKEKSKQYQTICQVHQVLKNKVQAEQTRDAAAVSAEHTLQTLGSVPIPEIYTHRQHGHSQAVSAAKTPSMKRSPSRLRAVTDQHGVEMLHPQQRSGSATRAQTSSELRATISGMGPPMHHGGRQTAGHFGQSTTPAHHVSTRPAESYAFPQTSHSASMSQQFSTRPIDRYTIDGRNHARNDQYVDRRTTMTPNIHSRMPANRGLF